MQKFSIYFLLCLLFWSNTFLSCGQTPNSTPQPATLTATEEKVSLTIVSGSLYGTLLLPTNKQKPTLVLIIAGSGATDRNGNNPMITNNSLKFLAEDLAKVGYASLRYDKRGIAESKAAMTKEEDLRFEDYAKDVVAWVDWLKKDNRIGKIVVLGHSEGALLGKIAVQQIKVAGFISLAGAGRPIHEVIAEQLNKQPEQLQKESKQITDSLLLGKTVSNVPFYLMSLYRPSVQPYLISWFKYKPAEEIAKISCPVAVVQGTTDTQVQLKDAQNLAAAQPKAKLVVIENMNHVLKQASSQPNENMATYSNPTLPLHPELVKQLEVFLKGL